MYFMLAIVKRFSGPHLHLFEEEKSGRGISTNGGSGTLKDNAKLRRLRADQTLVRVSLLHQPDGGRNDGWCCYGADYDVKMLDGNKALDNPQGEAKVKRQKDV